MKRVLFAGAAFCAMTLPAFAQDALCSKLSWPLEHERALLNGTVDLVVSGTTRKAIPDKALSLILNTGDKAALPNAPGKQLDPKKFAGFVILPVTAPGDYLVSLSAEGWIDTVQNGVALTSAAHTGDEHCPGLRKSVRFTLTASPLTLQIGNAPADHIEIAVTPTH